MHVPEMFSDHGMFMFLYAEMEMAASVSHKSHMNSYTTLCWLINMPFRYF